MKIIIDAGHGGKDYGGGSNSFITEKDMNLKISLYQYKRFKRLGIDTALTRDCDIYLSPKLRSEIVKNSNAHICISNHINASSNSKAEGAETIYSIYSNGKLANLMLNEIIIEGAKGRRAFCKKSNRNPKKDYYYMHRLTGKVQTIIIEYGFATNVTDTAKIINNWRAYAEAVVRATAKYLDANYELPVMNGFKMD